MNTLCRSILLTLWLAAGLLALPPAEAASAPAEAVDLRLVQGNCPSLGQAVEQVRRQYNGRIVSAETQSRGNREVHVIKVLTEDGKVKTVRVNGCTRQGRG